MTKFNSRPKFFTDASGQLQKYLYCSCCISRAYLPHEEGTEIFHACGDRQKIYYCKSCRSNKHRPDEHADDATNEIIAANAVKDLEKQQKFRLKQVKVEDEELKVEEPATKKYFVIMLLNAKDHYCTQICESVDQFIKEINADKKIEGLYYPPFKLVYKRAFVCEQSAKEEAHKIKAYSRERKITLVKDQSNEL